MSAVTAAFRRAGKVAAGAVPAAVLARLGLSALGALLLLAVLVLAPAAAGPTAPPGPRMPAVRRRPAPARDLRQLGPELLGVPGLVTRRKQPDGSCQQPPPRDTMRAARAVLARRDYRWGLSSPVRYPAYSNVSFANEIAGEPIGEPTTAHRRLHQATCSRYGYRQSARQAIPSTSWAHFESAS